MFCFSEILCLLILMVVRNHKVLPYITHLRLQFLIWDLWYFLILLVLNLKFSLFAIQRHCMISKDVAQSTNYFYGKFSSHLELDRCGHYKHHCLTKTALTKDKTMSKPESCRAERCGTPPRSWAWGCGTLWSACRPWSGAGAGNAPLGQGQIHQDGP